jgi:large subunit ribosomal protein L13
MSWLLINAENQILGRLATRIANHLTGKVKTNYVRNRDMGDHVVIINAKKIRVSGKKVTQKVYKHYSGYQSGLKQIPYARMVKAKPEYPLMHAVKGMLPKNSLGNSMLKKLLIYPDAQHPHAAQKPKEIKLS